MPRNPDISPTISFHGREFTLLSAQRRGGAVYKSGNVILRTEPWAEINSGKKRKDFKCPESAVREKELDRQLSSLIQKVFRQKTGRKNC